MPVLHLGVIDMPYNEAPGVGHNSRKTPNETTGDVAEILENKYHIMEVFFEEHKEGIAQDLEVSLAGALENLLMGAPARVAPFGQASAKIENRFKKFLSEKELDRLGIPGVPTKASLMGTSSRFKGKKGTPRPSFIDTGLYENSFKAWVD